MLKKILVFKTIFKTTYKRIKIFVEEKISIISIMSKIFIRALIFKIFL